MRRRFAADHPFDLVVDDRVVTPVELATIARARRTGLLGRNHLVGALWIEPCKQVHTFRMSFDIDVAYLDPAGRVLEVRRMPPGRLGPLRLRARSVLEAEAGAFEAWGLVPATVVHLRARATPTGWQRPGLPLP